MLQTEKSLKPILLQLHKLLENSMCTTQQSLGNWSKLGEKKKKSLNCSDYETTKYFSIWLWQSKKWTTQTMGPADREQPSEHLPNTHKKKTKRSGYCWEVCCQTDYSFLSLSETITSEKCAQPTQEMHQHQKPNSPWQCLLRAASQELQIPNHCCTKLRASSTTFT